MTRPAPVTAATLLLLAALAPAADPPRKAEPGPDGVTRVRLLPPGPGNPRNSEGAFVTLKDGRILFVYTHFTGGGADHAEAHLASRASADGGLTWTDTDEVVVPNEGKQNVMSVSLLRLADGRVALFYLRKDGPDDCRLLMRTSADEAKTWSAPVFCTNPRAYYVVNNDRVVQLKSGRLVVPAARHNLDPAKGGRWSDAMRFLSDDAGKSWRPGKTVLPRPPQSRSGLQEPGVVELKDGRLMMLCRTDLGCQYRSHSADGGDTWENAKPSDIKSPLSPASVKRVPKTGDLLLAWNDHSSIDPKLKGKRTPFTVAISKDDGRTWGKPKVLEDDPDGWYCYTAIHFAGHRVLLGHCAGDARVGRLNRTQVTAFPVEWLDK